MSNLQAFNVVARRAAAVESKRTNFNDSLSIKVPTSVISFAEMHIRMLEDQLAEAQRKLSEQRNP